MKFHEDGSRPADKAIFVFGSNLNGHHGGGAAYAAYRHFGAEVGVGVGPTGQSYAIPTLNREMDRMALADIRKHVADFITYARSNPNKRFFVTRVGCGIAGFEDRQIAPMFSGAPGNCSFAEDWREFLRPNDFS
ncbi:MAG: hypothetical protein ING75_03650 [Rhodocyclaceae bacterium]|nr:hypothetical protein [Rhodocyclaceae bacterium]